MKILELTPGVYKVRKKDYVTPYGAKPSRTTFKTEIRLLRVTGHGEKCRYFMDHDTHGQHPSKMNFFEEEFEVVCRIQGTPAVINPRITISFQDAAGDQFSYTVTDAWALRNVFDSMDWLKKPFGFTPRRKNK